MLFGILSKILTEEELIKLQLFNDKQTRLYLKLLQNKSNIQYTTSTGRILDATSALLGFCDIRTYDGRPAMVLESKATSPLKFEPIFSKKDGVTILMTTPLFDFLYSSNAKKASLAATAQMYLAEGLYTIAEKTAQKNNVPIVFSGGVAYNRMISGFLLQHGVLVNKNLPSGDGGICYGQSYLANLSYKE
jgi:hydrogenase maturation protein HypF